jgi:restriction system protein
MGFRQNTADFLIEQTFDARSAGEEKLEGFFGSHGAIVPELKAVAAALAQAWSWAAILANWLPLPTRNSPLKFKLNEKSLFAILLRSPWWISYAIAIAIGVAGVALLPANLYLIGALGGFSFIVIGSIAAYRQFQAPSNAHVAGTLEKIAAMSWRDFSAALEKALIRQGFEIERLKGDAADLLASKAGRSTLIACKRWKAARLGIETFQALHQAGETMEANGCLCITTAEVTDKAKQYAAAHQIRLIQATELAHLLRPFLVSQKT